MAKNLCWTVYLGTQFALAVTVCVGQDHLAKERFEGIRLERTLQQNVYFEEAQAS